MLYRVMKVHADGKPLVGTCRNMLGVRPVVSKASDPRRKFDVDAEKGTDLVLPGTLKGLSVSTAFDRLIIGPGEEIWEIDVDELTAVFSETPWTRLNEIVRREMASGRSAKEIAEEWVAMADDIWNLPELSNDGSDAFGDTLDALVGNTHSDSCYKDSPRMASAPNDGHSSLPNDPRFHSVASH